MSGAAADDVVVRTVGGPRPRLAWARDLYDHRVVLLALARKDFQTRYKRASFGVAWAVVLPLLQAGVMAFIFAKVARFPVDGVGIGIGAFVLAGTVPYSYFSATLLTASTAIVDGSGMADKVWFPRAVLVLVPCLSNAAGFVIAAVLAVVVCPLVGGTLSFATLLVVPAAVLLLGLVGTAGMVLAAGHVYFRDVKFLLQAALFVWMYVTPVVYPRSALGDVAWLIDLNPLTGPVELFHTAFGATSGGLVRPVLVSAATVVVLFVAAVEIHRRHDRLFVDLL